MGKIVPALAFKNESPYLCHFDAVGSCRCIAGPPSPHGRVGNGRLQRDRRSFSGVPVFQYRDATDGGGRRGVRAPLCRQETTDGAGKSLSTSVVPPASWLSVGYDRKLATVSLWKVWRSLDVDDTSAGLTNGVKLGQSTAYDSSRYSADIELFRRMAFADDLSSAEFGCTDLDDGRSSSSGSRKHR
jgi:hypothetical protein